MTDGESTIAGHCGQARQSLTTLLASLTESQGQHETESTSKPVLDTAPVEDVLDRFLLWAGNLGAMRAPISRLSLDHRLADAPEVKELICQYLADLQEAVDDLAEIVQGVSSNHDIMADDDEQGPSDEAAMLLEIVTESVKALFHVGILVRKAGADDRFRRAQKTPRTVFPESFDINHATEKYPKLRKGADGLLGTRVGSAISKRRQFIKYCRDHRDRLGREEAEEDPEEVETAPGPTPTEMLSSKASTFHPEMVPSNVLLSTVLEDDKEEDDVASLISTATVIDRSSQLELPKLCDLSIDGHPFECPICFTLQSFQKERAWRNHAFRDLRAYVCTVGGTECDSELFGDYNSWFEHELRQHRAQYACSLCNDGQLVSEADLKSHIGSNHGGFGSQQLHQLLDASRQMPAKIRAVDCPFCDTWEEKLRERRDPNTAASPDDDREIFVSLNRFKRHVAMHQEDLAVFAMPRTAENPGTSDRGTDDSQSNTSGSVAAWSPVAESPANERNLDGSDSHDGKASPLQGSYDRTYSISAEDAEFLRSRFDEALVSEATLNADSDGTTDPRKMAQPGATASDQESDNGPPTPPQARRNHRPGTTDQESEDRPPTPPEALPPQPLRRVSRPTLWTRSPERYFSTAQAVPMFAFQGGTATSQVAPTAPYQAPAVTLQNLPADTRPVQIGKQELIPNGVWVCAGISAGAGGSTSPGGSVHCNQEFYTLDDLKQHFRWLHAPFHADVSTWGCGRCPYVSVEEPSPTSPCPQCRQFTMQRWHWASVLGPATSASSRLVRVTSQDGTRSSHSSQAGYSTQLSSPNGGGYSSSSYTSYPSEGYYRYPSSSGQYSKCAQAEKEKDGDPRETSEHDHPSSHPPPTTPTPPPPYCEARPRPPSVPPPPTRRGTPPRTPILRQDTAR